MKKDVWRFTGIRRKLIVYYLLITVLMGITSFYSYYNTKSVINRLKSIFVDYIYLNNLNADVNTLETEVEKYLSTKSSDALLNYYTLYNKLQEQASAILNEKNYDQDGLMLKDIGNMIESLLNETDAAINAKRGRISSEYIAHFTRSIRISEYIKLYINNLLNSKLQEGSLKYASISKNMEFISYLNVFLIIGSILFNIFLAIFFTYRITKPLMDLSYLAVRVSKGDFDVRPVEIETNDEISILAEAFNKMVVSIRNYIGEIKNQAEVEKKLKEQEMQNLKMRNILKEAELKALQSQINPHFLFNTLNAAAQLAMMEGADKSSEFIENVAKLFRYNLKKLDTTVTLQDEINNVKTYMYILKTRFGDRVDFKVEVDEKVLDVEMPCTIIQPVVENAFIHGLEDVEEGGFIKLTVKRDDDKVLIEVVDNGRGMSKEKVKAILSADYEDLSKKHVTGIGLHNIINRLRLFYNISAIQDVIEIDSKIGEGTKVTLKIPLMKGDKEND
ncbi:signal transduction histidine kinase, LytS [Thermoanaerobacter mathranii subsp. mathranii str. A3]|uniref:histidine kinase n=1 Tax=Thermoanaerobacter mathranii subsp. mathranii (strain DSM 11426 / CCUG 53645 / CIP 108742 / A3) TaxID=583358 RepID=A0ABM5LN27_THEM3|nr:sensor histidine kinase [Thermoanaerobacter mathranii]ADH60104.1 signal transduction histidine kinase, LytS [Thermoanaerobacter mathranii subsp. mathranii str. A3]